MEYSKQEDLKVTCIASEEDFSFFGITLDDLMERTPGAVRFLKKTKELAGISQKVEWTNTAYTLQISMLPDARVALVFSETIADYIENLKHSMAMADGQTIEALKGFIQTLEESDEQHARELVARFEKNIREENM